MTHFKAKPPETLVVKYGGNAMGGRVDEVDPLLSEVAAMWKAGTGVVLVHGGGPEIDAALAERGIVTQRIAGQRVTDAATLAITEAVLCGSVNKRIVRDCLALGLPAAGISGQDGPTLLARRACGGGGENLGYVGEVASVETRLIRGLLRDGFLPVIAPLALSVDGTHAYNVNADLAAAAIAGALKADAFVLVTNVARVLRDVDDAASGIERLTSDEALRFAGSDACRSSMKPKVIAAATAARNGAAASYICAAKTGTIASALSGDSTLVSS
jgi:acetylglutamate kinase